MRKLTLSVSTAITAFLAAPVVLVTPTPAYSQALEEITVTARKVTESLQEVPLAITALSGDDIERLNLQDLSDITQQDTSVQFDEGFTPSDTRITIRGLSPTRGRPNAATLIDGIDVTSEAVSNAGGSTLINPRLIDIERIEIVKGPQSALYGRSAFAGAIQYVTKDPADKLEGDIFVGTNNQRGRELRGSVSIPITDTLGVLVNGYGWDERGIYKNTATQDYIGGGDGAGGSVTFKWEPTDTVGVKWRTEYSKDNFDVAAQALLNDLNTTYDLADPDRVPNSSLCNATDGPSGVGPLPGPLDDGGCARKYVYYSPQGNPDEPGYIPQQLIGPGDDMNPLYGRTVNETFVLNEFFDNVTPTTPPNLNGNPNNIGAYPSQPGGPSRVDQYNKTVVSYYKGEIPDADELTVAVNPNYRTGPGSEILTNAEDYDGTTREVFRTALNVDWAINDTLDFISNTGYVDSTVDIQTDIGKYYVDRCTTNALLLAEMPNPLDLANPDSSYLDALVAAGQTDVAKFAPCDYTLGGDGINDASTQFIQDDSTDTQQISQEFRLAWQASESINFTTGLQFWQEKVDLVDINSTTILGGASCFLGGSGGANPVYRDSTQIFSNSDGDNTLGGVNVISDQCGTAFIAAAPFMKDTYQGRLDQPQQTLRQTDHYSWYGSLDMDLTERLTFRVEARYTKEDNEVTGLVQTPCVDGSQFFSINSDFADQSGCENDPAAISQARTETANGGQATGPSAALLCGQTGRCDYLGLASSSTSIYYAGNNPNNPQGPTQGDQFNGDSWWAFGYRPSPGNPETLQRQDNFWAPKATLEYFWNDDVMTYFSWSRGIKPGGFSLLTSGAFGLDANLDGVYDEIEFEPERLDVWEVGAKTTLFDGRVRLNGSVFLQNFKDKQVTVQKVTGGTTGTEVENISGSEVNGLELDATWQITENWLVSGGYTFLKTEYTDYTITTSSSGDISRINGGNPSEVCSEVAIIDGSENENSPKTGCVMSFNGNELERAPKHAFLANLSYTNSLFDTGAEWYGEANYRYQDTRWMEAFNVVEFQAYSLTDLRFGILANAWDVQLFMTNVFDNDTVISGGPNPGIPTGTFSFGLAAPPPAGSGINAGPKLPSDIYANMPNPRIVGINAKFRFGQ